MRDKRIMRAEEKANMLPTKLTLGTMLFTVPPLLVILIGPSIYGMVTHAGPACKRPVTTGKDLRQAALLTVCAALLAGCTPASGVSRNAPYGIDARGKAVDGMTVGHRLMEAGEYELALKSYLRGAGEVGINVDVLSALARQPGARAAGPGGKASAPRAEIDPDYVPALNNLGVVLMEKDTYGEARAMFQKAFALDSGETDSIRENLKLAIAKSEANVYSPVQEEEKDGFPSRPAGKRQVRSPVRSLGGAQSSQQKDAKDAPSCFHHAVPWQHGSSVSLSELV